MQYILYARKSTDDEDRQLLSIEAQITELREFALKESLSIHTELIEAKTAKDPGRPLFNSMLQSLEAQEADGILAWHPDRLARNSVDGGKIIYLLDKGVIKDLKFPTYRLDNNAQGKFMLSIIFGQGKDLYFKICAKLITLGPSPNKPGLILLSFRSHTEAH